MTKGNAIIKKNPESIDGVILWPKELITSLEIWCHRDELVYHCRYISWLISRVLWWQSSIPSPVNAYREMKTTVGLVWITLVFP